MRRDFFPDAESAMLQWSTNFLSRLTELASEVGVSQEQLAQYRELHERFAERYAEAITPDTAGPRRTFLKNEARRELEHAARTLGRQVRGMAHVTPGQRMLLGLSTRDAGGGGRRVGRPISAPDIFVLDVVGRAVTVRLRDGESSTRRGRPAGVSLATLLMSVSDVSPESPEDWRIAGQTSATRATIEFPLPLPAGARVWVSARWCNARGEAGPIARAAGTNLQWGPGMGVLPGQMRVAA